MSEPEAPVPRWRQAFPDGFWAWFSALPFLVKLAYALVYAGACFLLTWFVIIPVVPYNAILALIVACGVWSVLDIRYRRFRLLRLERSLLSSKEESAKAVVTLMNRPRAEQWAMYRSASKFLGLPDPGPYTPEAL